MKKSTFYIAISIFLLLLSLLTFIGYSVFMQQNSDVDFTDDQLSSYSDWKTSYLMEYEGNLLVNTSDSPDFLRTVSEAQGYGMFITVIAGEKGVDSAEQDFNLLYNYYLNNLDNGTNLMSWKQEQESLDSPTLTKFENNATDGDLYIAYSLIRASKVWEEHSDEYLKQANLILEDILVYNYIKNDSSAILSLGSWVTEDSDVSNVFRSSDVIPLFFQEFYASTGNETWLTLETNMMKYIKDVSKENTSGLVSDFIVVNNGIGESPKNIVFESETDKHFSWNASRVPLQIAYTYDQKESKELLEPMLTFFKGQEHVYAGYLLDGTPTVDYDSMVFGGLLEYIVKKDSKFEGIPTNFEYFMEQEITGVNYYGDTLFLISTIY